MIIFSQERLLNETSKAATLPLTKSNHDAPMKPVIVMRETSTPIQSSNPSRPAIPLPSPQLSSPFFMKKGKPQERAEVGSEKVEPGRSMTMESTGKVKNQEESCTGGEMKNGAGNHRPTNPFAKSSSNQEKSSLLDAIKKMKKADESKR